MEKTYKLHTFTRQKSMDIVFNSMESACSWLIRMGLISGILVISALISTARVTAPERSGTGSKLVEGLDTYHFTITTDSEEAQKWFNQGLVLLYGFNHGEAIRSFMEATLLDPEAAMPWWGIAYANGMHINMPEMTEEQWKNSYDAAQRALSALDDETELERALVHAVATRTAWPVPEEQRPYDEAFAQAMEQVYAQFPDSPDVAVLYAESLMNLQPWDYWTEDLKPKGKASEIIAAIEHALEVDPTHPQAAHLYIHALEAGPNPGKAEAAADMLRDRVPGAGHLVHMPSHLYVRVGRFADAATANESAVAADDAFFQIGTDPGMYYVYHAHNLHFLAFASMMEGRYEPALAAARRLEVSVPDEVLDQFAFLIEGVLPTTYHVMIRFGKWEEILQEKTPSANRPMMLAIHHYARGIALAALGRTDEANSELARFEKQVEKVPEDWMVFANKAHDVLPIGRLMLKGEIAYREGRLEDAWAMLREAIKAEDRLVYDEPPGWMIPVRHSLGALLMEAGQYQQAEKLYREDQMDHPNNGWSLLGLRQSLEAQGRMEEAKTLIPKIEQAWKRVAVRPTSSCLCAPGSS
ncbi:MAG: tetratricopeptide repeat protein [bacterium]|jgi:tetratricopeptide (TPR) repeat protein